MSGDSSDVVILYHGGGCRDGFCSAWLMRKLYPDAKFHAVNYGEPPPPPNLAGKGVFLVDFCYPADVLARIAADSRQTVVIDHHEQVEEATQTAASLLEDREKMVVVYDAHKSGARLVWDYLSHRMPVLLAPGDPHWLVRYVEDRDLWRWAMPDSREVNAAIRLRPLEFEEWDRMAEADPAVLAAEGRLVLRRDAEIIETHVRHAVERVMFKHAVPVVNATVLHSEIGNALCQNYAFAATYYDDLKAGVRRWSLRSSVAGIDVTALAKSMGGGGHPSGRAAGYQEVLK